MKKMWYFKKAAWFDHHPEAGRAVVHLCSGLSYLIYVAYILALFLLLRHQQWKELAGFILIPGSGFLLETWIRAKLNWARPYEVMGIEPLKKKETRGKSFPSRHSFSAAILSITFFSLMKPFGLFLMLATIVIGLCRVLMGVHWIRDVVIGILFGWIYGLLIFLI